MPAEPRGGVAQALCRTLLRAAPDLTDGQLLDRFLAGREEAAFEALIRRHGPMVFGVCRRVLGNAADADDALQATFVVLVRKARALAGRGTVGDFLYGVAYHTALKARAQAVKRRAKEARAAVPDRPDADAAEHNELLRLLDRELARLPTKYREPVVLCDLEGRPRAEVAGLLGIPEGTLSSRLTTARRTLAGRLGRHGLSVSAGAVAAALGRSAEAGVPGSLVGAAVRAAGGAVPAAVAQLAAEVAKMMLLSKLKAGAVGFAAVAALGAAVGLAAAQGEKPAAPPEPPAKAAARPAAKADEPAWRKEFHKVYGLADGEVLKRVPPPYPDSRGEFFKSVYGDPGQTPYEHRFTVFRWRDGRVDPNKITMQVPVKPDEGATLSTVLDFVASLSAQMVEGNSDLLNARVTGDFTVRDGADPTKVVARLERILRDECKLPVALSFEHVEQDVVVARGKFVSKPLEGRKPNHVEIYARAVLDPAQNGSGGSGPDAMPKFLQHLGSYINRRIVNEVEQPPGRVSWTNNLRGMIIRDPVRGIDTDAEDRDPDAVLRNVAAQTGLTFKTEKRTVRVLFVRKWDEKKEPVNTTGEFSRTVQAILDGAESVDVVSLDPGTEQNKPDDGFRGWKVLGRTTVKGDARKHLLQALGEGVREGDLSGSVINHYRHGLRATHDGKTVDLVISFEHRNIRVYLGGSWYGFTSVTDLPEVAFDKVLLAAGVPLAPKPEPAQNAWQWNVKFAKPHVRLLVGRETYRKVAALTPEPVKFRGTLVGSDGKTVLVQLAELYTGDRPAVPAADLTRDFAADFDAALKKYKLPREGGGVEVIVEGEVVALMPGETHAVVLAGFWR